VQRSTLKNIVTPVLIILVAGGATAAMVWQKKEAEKKPVVEPATIVETVRLQSQDLHFTVESQGNVSPHTETTLVSEISSTVLEVSPKFVAGGFFKRGDVLLKLDPADYEVAVQQSRANLLSMKARLALEEAQAEQAQKEWDLSGRARTQAPRIALRIPYLEEARANVQVAEADLKKSERKLSLTVIRAPYDGMVKEKLVDIGQYVTTGAQLARTFAVDFAEVRLPLTDQDIAFLELPRPTDQEQPEELNGPPVELTGVIGGVVHTWQARIVRTEGVIDQNTRVHYAVARVADPYSLQAPGLRPPLAVGSFVKAKIQGVLMQDVIAVPMQAVRGMDQVLIKDAADRLRIRRVKIIRTDGTYAYVRDAALDDQQAITTAVYNPIDGMPVRVADGS
jgi:RND family efflux transporter MFP subunit